MMMNLKSYIWSQQLVLGLGALWGCGKTWSWRSTRSGPGLLAKWIFSTSYSKPAQINTENKTKPIPQALGLGFPASLALSFPFEGCSISSDAL